VLAAPWPAGSEPMIVEEEGSGWRLRAARAERGLTEEALAGEMRRWAELLGTPRTEITAGVIAEWESGARPMDGGARRLLRLALETPDQSWCGLAPPLDVDVWSLFRPARPELDDPERRRHLLRSEATVGEPAGLDPDRLGAVLDETARVDRRVVESLGFVSRQFTRRWGTEPAHTTRRRLHGHLQVLVTLLDDPMPGDLRRGLESAAAATAAFAGSVSILVGRPADAGVYLDIGRRMARAAGDAENEAMALLFTSQLYSLVCPAQAGGDTPRAQALLEAADRRLGRTTAPIANAWVLLRGAEEWAGGDERTAFRLVDEADRLAAGADRIPADGICCRWSTDLHTAYRGNIAILAGRPASGIPLLEAALARLPRELVATRPMATADLGGAYAQVGEIDQACTLLARALALALAARLPDPVLRVRRVRDRRLAGHAALAPVRDLDERLRAAQASFA